jgi:hypothetical protein
MFKINNVPEFTHDVTVMVPTDDGHDPQKLRTRFRALPLNEAQAFDLNTAEGTDAYLKRIVVTCEGLVDAEDKPVVCTEVIRDQQFELSYVRLALIAHLGVAMNTVNAKN